MSSNGTAAFESIDVPSVALPEPGSYDLIMAEGTAIHIVSTPGTRGGKPRIAGTRIAVADVAGWHLREGRSLRDISATWDLPMAALHAAMSYYYDHRTEIDRQTREAEALADAVRAKHPSKLQHNPQVAGDA